MVLKDRGWSRSLSPYADLIVIFVTRFVMAFVLLILTYYTYYTIIIIIIIIHQSINQSR